MHGVATHLLEFLRWFYRYRTLRLTPDGTRFLLLTFGIGIAAVNTGNNLLYLLLAMMLSLIVVSGLLSERTLKQLRIARRMPSQFYAKRPASAAFVISNGQPRSPAFSLQVQDVVSRVAVDRGVRVLHVAPQASVRHPYTMEFPRRGRQRLDGVKVITRFPFGLISKAATWPLPDELVVYPEIRSLPSELFRELSALGREQAIPRRGHGSGLHNLRDYLSGDDSRAIHWKTSARQGRLIVREAEAEDQRSATIALATNPPWGLGTSEAEWDQAFDAAVTLAASLVDFFYRRAYRIRLLFGDQEVPPGTGAEHYDRLLRALALCERGAESNALPASLRVVGDDTQAGIYTVLVLPWEDLRLNPIAARVSRLLRPEVVWS